MSEYGEKKKFTSGEVKDGVWGVFEHGFRVAVFDNQDTAEFIAKLSNKLETILGGA